jgi:small subunit ribosomal protein S21
MQVQVQKNQVERAIRELKKKLILEGVFREVSKRKFYYKPSIKSKMKRDESLQKRAKDRRRKQKNIFS